MTESKEVTSSNNEVSVPPSRELLAVAEGIPHMYFHHGDDLPGWKISVELDHSSSRSIPFEIFCHYLPSKTEVTMFVRLTDDEYELYDIDESMLNKTQDFELIRPTVLEMVNEYETLLSLYGGR